MNEIDENTGNNDIINNNQKLNGSDKIKIYVDTNSNNNTNSYSNINNKDLCYETVDDNNFNNCNEEYFNNINNNMKNSNDSNCQKNDESNNKDFNAVTPLNLMKMKNCQRNLNNNNDDNINENNSNMENNEKKSKDIGYQTYSGPFRNKKIKVNMVEKENKNIKHENMKSAIIENDKFNSSQQKKMFKNSKGTNSSHNLKVSVNSSIKKDDKKNLYIETDFKGNKKFKKNTSIISNNKLKNRINNYSHNVNKDKNKKIINQNNYEDKNKDKEKCTDNENTAKTFNSNDQDKSRQKDKDRDILNNLSIKPNILYSNNNFKLSKNSSLGNITNNLNFNILPLSRENTTYIKKNTSNINKYNDGVNAYLSNTNRPSVIKHKKNYSISSSCYNTQRNSTSRMNAKSKNSNSGYLYSPKHNRAESKTIIMPEYKVKLEKIKSRVISLLNVYSLLALKSANSNSRNDREIQEENINKLEKNEIC